MRACGVVDELPDAFRVVAFACGARLHGGTVLFYSGKARHRASGVNSRKEFSSLNRTDGEKEDVTVLPLKRMKAPGLLNLFLTQRLAYQGSMAWGLRFCLPLFLLLVCMDCIIKGHLN